MALDAIHNDLVRTIGEDAVAYSTVTKYVRSAQFSGRNEVIAPEAPDVERNPVNEAILMELAEFPFPFPFRLCASLRGGSIFRGPLCTGTGTSGNHFASLCDIFDGSHTFWRRNRSRFGSKWQSNYCRSSRCKARASGTTLSPWTSGGFICSVSMI
jgi:hypothetical protein